MSEQAQLTVEGIDVSYGHGRARKQVLHGASLVVGRGQIVGLIGESGSGKSTLARAVLGLTSVTAGAIHVGEHKVNALTAAQLRAFRRRGDVQYIFQDPLRSLDGDVTVGDSIAEPLRIRGAFSRAEVNQRVIRFARKAQLDQELLNRHPGELSGGQRQRAAIARALISEPRLLILDEPVSALDAANRVRILDGLLELREEGMALLYISHDLGSVAGITDRTAVLHQGRVVEEGWTEDVVAHPQHPYTQLLIGSAPTLSGEAFTREQRDALRAVLAG